MIHPERIRVSTGDGPVASRRYVLYWMQQSQRVSWNHALEYAIEVGNGCGLPVLICFGIAPCFPEAGPDHYRFMLNGLAESAVSARARGLGFVVRRGEPPEVALGLARDAALTVMDRGYLRLQKAWRERFSRSAPCPVVEVESDVVVPLAAASGKEEHAAFTLRPKIHGHLARFMVPLAARSVRVPWPANAGDPQALPGIDWPVGDLAEDNPGRSVCLPAGGARAGWARLEAFLRHGIERYDADRNDPGEEVASGLSPYLHFGQISALQTALAVHASTAPEGARAAFLEELIVRRELAANFVHYNPQYDRYAGLPQWSRRSLEQHACDPRPYTYSARELEAAATHDPYWNAAQEELLRTGRMHGYMRMYWGKKILEWTPEPEAAFHTALDLNNRLELDGRDPNGFAGVAWCFGKHDRPWAERQVFGAVRYMNAAGLRRKFAMEGYLARVRHL